MQHTKPEYFYYPLRALSEFFAEEKTEKALSKRLNADALLQYKQSKEVLTGDHMLFEFGRTTQAPRQAKQKARRSTANAGTEAGGYSYLHEDILKELRGVI